jgi:hypothetical protein
MENNNQLPASFGFVNADGNFQTMSGLSTLSLEFVSKTSYELLLLLETNIALECYETCAIIRDVLNLRGNGALSVPVVVR